MPHPIDIYVGNRLQFYRSMCGKSQEELGKAVGITFQQIQKYERGINRIGASRLYEFAHYLNIPVMHFFVGYEEVEADKNSFSIENKVDYELVEEFEKHIFSRETLEIMRSYNKITSKNVKYALCNLIKVLSK